MNPLVRNYLISVARKNGAFAAYSDVVQQCNLQFDLSSSLGRDKLSEVLADVSVYEHSAGRPLLSSLVIYKDANNRDHGPGFYRLAERLGKGNTKQFQEELFGFSEAETARRFWQDETNFQKFAALVLPDQSTNPSDQKAGNPNFFTEEELDFFEQWHLQVYDKEDPVHVAAKNRLMETVWEKCAHLSRLIVNRMPGLAQDARKTWHQRGYKQVNGAYEHAAIFKPYTWVKVFKDTDRGKDIFFTFEINADERGFIYKLDCQRNRSPQLEPSQIQLFDQLRPETARWNWIGYDELLEMNWDSLAARCIGFISQHMNAYDDIMKAVWGEPVQKGSFQNMLIKRNRPGGIADLPAKTYSFIGRETDWEGKARAQKQLGNSGERLVRDNEVSRLNNAGQHDKAARVRLVQDGSGYDVLSFWPDGREKYIEVKTTSESQDTPFYLSDNEVAFIRSKTGECSIYRVFNYDYENNFGEYFELTGDIETELVMMPISYRVQLKKQ